MFDFSVGRMPWALLAVAFSLTHSVSANSLLSSGNLDLGLYQTAYEKATAFVSTLTNAEKVAVITGGSINSTNGTSWTALTSGDGFAGINQKYFVSAFPVGQALAMTWDRDHIRNQAYALGREFYSMGTALISGPVAGPLGRTPYGGRLADGFSPDPYLTGIALEHSVRGMNAAGVIPLVRHFLLNEQETNRTTLFSKATATTEVYSSNADDKTIHELYMWPWADGIRAGAGAIMCAMTDVNGTLSCENDRLLNRLLKEELGFPGMVTPDVSSQATSYGSANGGLDLGAREFWSTEILNAGIQNGSFSQARLDDMAVRNVIGYYYAGLDDGKLPAASESFTAYRSIRGDHAELIRQIGSDSLVLLKNNVSGGGGLPLKKPRAISLFGAHAGPGTTGPNFEFSVLGLDDPFPGHLVTSRGSGQGSLSYLVTPYEALNIRARQDGSLLRYIFQDTDPASNLNTRPPGPSLGRGTGVIPTFANYAANTDVCLAFINSASGEGADRKVLSHPTQDDMILTIASHCNNTIVVINTPGPRLMEAWIEHPNITAVLYGSLLGQESGHAITDILYGATNPSAKLVYTIARHEADYPATTCYTTQCPFHETTHIDYRHFDTVAETNTSIPVRFPFGHGLSYTTFTYTPPLLTISNPTALSSPSSTGPLTPGGPADLFDEVLAIRTKVKNTGSIPGAEVAQLYIKYPKAAAQPPRQLRGFEKVFLQPGEEREVVFRVRRRDVSFWDVEGQGWRIVKGAGEEAVYGFEVANAGVVRGVL